MATAAEKRVRNAAFVFGLIECLFLAGVIFGWAALVYILKADGVFSHLCGNGTAVAIGTRNGTMMLEYPTCQAQDERLNLGFTIGNFALQGSTLFIGIIFDAFGLRVTRVIGSVLYIAGCLLLGLASVDMPDLIFPGLILIGVGGINLLVTNMTIGNFFCRLRLGVVTIFSAAFDTSSATVLLMKILYENGVQRLHSFVALASVAAVVISISTFFILPRFKVVPRDFSRQLQVRLERTADGDEVVITNEAEVQTQPIVEGEAMSNRTLMQCIFSPTYILAVLWHGFLQIRFYVYLGSLNVWLQFVTGNNVAEISFYTNVFSAIMMGGLLMGPLEGLILALEERRLQSENMSYWRKLKTVAVPEFLCSLFGLLLSVFNLFSAKQFLYIQFITMTAMRAFLYGLNAAFIFLAFPPEHFGKLFGILMTFNGFTVSSQYGLFKWSEGPPRDPFPVNVFLLVLVVLSFVQPLYLWFVESVPFLQGRTNKRKDSVALS